MTFEQVIKKVKKSKFNASSFKRKGVSKNIVFTFIRMGKYIDVKKQNIDTGVNIEYYPTMEDKRATDWEEAIL